MENDSSKIKVVEDFPIPTTQKTVCQFLGPSISYLCRYVKGFAFDALKWKLVEAPMPRSWHKFERIIPYLRRYVKGFAKMQNHWMVYLPQVLSSPIRIGISPTNGHQSIRMCLMPWSGNFLKHPYLDDFSEPCCLEVDASLKGLYHTSVGMLRGLLKLQNHLMVYLPQVLPSPRRTGISLTNGRQSVRMRLMPWSGNLLKHPYLDDFIESCCLEVDASFKGLYHTSVGMLRGLLKLQNHWMVYLDDTHTHTWTTSVNHVA